MVENLEWREVGWRYFLESELVGWMKCESDTQDGENLTGCHV